MSIKPPRPPSPPLTALRAFEAAARLGGFTRAAEELCVTPGAIAQQIKQLEAWAGAPLFERQAQGVVLTEAGRVTLPTLSEAFDQIGGAVQVLRQAASPNRIHLAALPAIAQLWLAPRMTSIRKAMPDLELSVTAMEHPPNLAREPFDLSVFYGDAFGTVLEDDVIYPVCAPELLPRLGSLEDLASVPCLHDAVWSDDWRLWLEHVGLAHILPQGPTHSLYALAVGDALNGVGVLMAHDALIRHHVKSGALVVPFAETLTLPRQLRIEVRTRDRSRTLRQLLENLSGESGF